MARRPEKIELSEKELEKWMAQAMTDPVFVAREILGFNYDVDRKTNRKINVGTGGIMNQPPFTTMLDGMRDRENLLFMCLAPRGGLKSSCVVSEITRRYFDNPNRAQLFMSGTDAQVNKWSRTVRDVFEFNPLVRLALNNGESLKGKPWTVGEWILSCRTEQYADPSFCTSTLKKQRTGGHYHDIWIDDLIDWRNCRTPEALELAKGVLHIIKPLRLPGTKVVMTGTRWNPGDVYSYAQSLPGWKCLVLGNGYEIEEGADGLYHLTKGPGLFPQLTKDYLEEQLHSMELEDFCAQYMNMHVSGLTQAFRREWFQSLEWEPWMHQLTGWIVTDAAVSTRKGACMSTAIVVGIDRNHRIYLLDGFAGKVEPGQFVDELFGLHIRWQHQVNLTGWTIEKVTLGLMLEGWIEAESRRRGLRLNIREIPRSGGERSKDDRIRRLQPRFRAKEVFVVSTFPRTFRDNLKLRSLWDPAGHREPNTQENLPGGELVEQFAQFPFYPYKDIADALADVEYVYKDGERACYWRPPNEQSQIASVGHPVDAGRASGQDFMRSLGPAPSSTRR